MINEVYGYYFIKLSKHILVQGTCRLKEIVGLERV